MRPEATSIAQVGADIAPEQRLHPWSWLFTLLQQLKQFALPLLILLFTGRGDGNELWPLIGVAALVVVSLLRYFTYRYRIEADRLVIREGWLQRSRREVPFARIHNVALDQSLLHRLFGVAEVRLESAGGKKPEAQMRVLRLDQALALEALVRGRASRAASAPAGTEDQLLLQLPSAEVLRLGLLSDRGLVLAAAGFAALSQFSPRLLPNVFELFGRRILGWIDLHSASPARYALGALAVVLAAVLALRLLSVLLAWLQYYGFSLRESASGRLTVERGLLTRWRSSAPRGRIQAWTLREGLLHRWLRRRALQVDTAVADPANASRALKEIAPIATPAACDALIEHLLPDAGWCALDWQPLQRGSAWRIAVPGVAFGLVLTTAATWRFGGWGLLALLWLPWAALSAQAQAQRAGFACNGQLVAVRGGWWSRHWRFAEIAALQTLRLSRTPLDRRLGTATLMLDTTGASALGPPLRIRFVSEPTLTDLFARLSRQLGQLR